MKYRLDWIFRVLNNENVFKTARLWERYEKPFRKRGRLCYEKYLLIIE